MDLECLKSPIEFLKRMTGDLPDEAAFREYEHWWETEGKAISALRRPGGHPLAQDVRCLREQGG